MRKSAFALKATLAMLAIGLFGTAHADLFIFGNSPRSLTEGNGLQVDGDASLLPMYDQGWYHESGFHDVTNQNYIVGSCSTCNTVGEYRNWFAFDISNLAAPVSSLSLRLFSYGVTLTSGNYYLNDYTGSVASLLDGTAGVAGFNDLGSGTNFGFRFYQDTESNQFHEIDLNFAAIASLNSAISSSAGLWAIGGSFSAGDTPLPPPPPSPPSQVPEPSTLALLGLGLVGIGLRRRIKAS